jgi:hypothetical protein
MSYLISMVIHYPNNQGKLNSDTGELSNKEEAGVDQATSK